MQEQGHEGEVNLLEQRVIDALNQGRSLTRAELYARVRDIHGMSASFERVLNRLQRGGVVRWTGVYGPDQMIALREDW